MCIVVALVLGIVCGLRTMTSPAVTSWAARMGLFAVSGTPMAFMGFKYTPIIFTLLAIGELINDKLPNTPSRKAPPGFIARIVSGWLVGDIGGAATRSRLARAFGKELPAALLEDVAAIVISIVAVSKF